ncbi:MAG: FAD-binding protein [Myxococcota bacterium]
MAINDADDRMDRTQLVVIGSGAAGLMAALAAAPRAEVVLVTDRAVGRSNTAMAQGGLQLPLTTPTSLAAFVDDMLESARVPVNEARVRSFAGSVPQTVAQLVSWGLQLQRDEQGEPVRRIAGGMRAPRVVNTTTLIGPAIIKLLRRRLACSSVTVLGNCSVERIQPVSQGLRVELAGQAAIEASRVVCCSGGRSYQEALRRGHPTSNPVNQNHTLYDELVSLGLPRVEPDAYQYHPFGLVRSLKSGVGTCVPESINGFSVRLLDRHGIELGPIRQDRYALTRRMLEANEAGRALQAPDGHPGFRLTLSELPRSTLIDVFPKLHGRLKAWGSVGEDVLVFPFLHYQLGGFEVDPDGRSGVPGLWLAGEMVGGIHGRNRLMGNGLTDSLVHGRRAGLAACQHP